MDKKLLISSNLLALGDTQWKIRLFPLLQGVDHNVCHNFLAQVS